MPPIDEPMNETNVVELDPPISPAALETAYSHMSDRALLEYIAENIDRALTVLTDASAQLEPMLANPLVGGMLKMMGKRL